MIMQLLDEHTDNRFLDIRRPNKKNIHTQIKKLRLLQFEIKYI